MCTKVAWIVFVCLVLGASVQAAAPYSIHRDTAAASVRGALAWTSVTTAPFDDASGVLGDGVSYYYVVSAASGPQPVISLHKNVPLGTVRIGFDDEDPLSAPADPALSTVVVAPDSVPADGVTTVVVTIVPRDAAGVPLGTGLTVWLDGAALWPAFVVGGVVDNGDGSYTVRAASTLPASSEVWVRVEGIPLTVEPPVTFEDTGALDLREQAVERIESLLSASGPFDQIMEGLDPADHAAIFVEKGQTFSQLALDELDAWNDAVAVSDGLEKAVDELQKVIETPGGADPVAVAALADHLMDAARMLAVYHIAVAEASCGVCGQGGPEGVCLAREHLQAADDRRAGPDPDLKRVVDGYGKAIEEALGACG